MLQYTRWMLCEEPTNDEQDHHVLVMQKNGKCDRIYLSTLHGNLMRLTIQPDGETFWYRGSIAST